MAKAEKEPIYRGENLTLTGQLLAMFGDWDGTDASTMAAIDEALGPEEEPNEEDT